VKIGLLHSRVRIEERRVREALEARGATVVLLHEDDVAFDLHGRGFGDVDLVLESCEDYTLAQTALRTLEFLGVRTLNRPAVVDLCGNKALMTMYLIRAGLPVPRSEVALSAKSAQAAIERLGYPVVIKPLVGDDGQLLALIEDREAAEAILEHKEKLGTDRHHVYFVQEFVGRAGRDIRVLVIGEEPLAAEYRQSSDWAPTRDRKAEHVPCPLTEEIATLARGAARAFGGGLLEVGLLETGRGLLVNDVGTLDDFRSFAANGVDVAGAIAEYVVRVAVSANGRATVGTSNVGG
jgi:[lysine-biosynthesis-protein LysW]---L-2-aminoadipate ligase